MTIAHNLGFPRIGAQRELKKAVEAYWKGELDEAALLSIGKGCAHKTGSCSNKRAYS